MLGQKSCQPEFFESLRRQIGLVRGGITRRKSDDSFGTDTMRPMSNFEAPPKRDIQLKIMIAAEEKAELDKAAQDNDMTTSNLVRKAIKTYLAALKKRKKKK